MSDKQSDRVATRDDGAPLKTDKFSPASRYRYVPVVKLERPSGDGIAYLRRRFVPPPERFALLREHRVRQGERLDNIAAAELGDPEQFWQIADANGAIAPEELTETPGRRLRIGLPAGVPASDGGG